MCRECKRYLEGEYAVLCHGRLLSEAVMCLADTQQ